MNPAALSVFIFGIYLAVTGIGFLFMPNIVLPMLKFPKTDEHWIRVLGMVIGLLGFYYIIAARNDLTPFFWATVVGRFAVLICLSAIVIAKKGPSMLIVFGLIDAAGGVWTLLVM